VQADGLVDASTAAFIRAVELQAALAADVPAECAGCGVTPEPQLGPCAVVADSTFQVIPVRIDPPRLPNTRAHGATLLASAPSCPRCAARCLSAARLHGLVALRCRFARAVADELWLRVYAERYRLHAALCSHACTTPPPP
jgi:hypothetical protein